MGALTGGMGTAAQAAQSSIQWGAAGTALSALGALSAGKGQAQQYMYQSQVATNNAAITRQNESAGLVAGGYEESANKLATGQLIAGQKAAQAANGLDVNVGSPVAVRDSAATLGAMDAATIHFNAARAAYGLESEAGNLDAQSSLYKAAAKGAKTAGLAKAASTIISGASSLSSKWDQYKLQFPSTDIIRERN